MATAIGHELEGNFGAATQYVMNNFTIAELLASSATLAEDVPIGVELRRADVAGMNVTRPS